MVDRREPFVVTRSIAMVVLLTDDEEDELEERSEEAAAAAVAVASADADEAGSMSITRYSTT